MVYDIVALRLSELENALADFLAIAVRKMEEYRLPVNEEYLQASPSVHVASAEQLFYILQWPFLVEAGVALQPVPHDGKMRLLLFVAAVYEEELFAGDAQTASPNSQGSDNVRSLEHHRVVGVASQRVECF